MSNCHSTARAVTALATATKVTVPPYRRSSRPWIVCRPLRLALGCMSSRTPPSLVHPAHVDPSPCRGARVLSLPCGGTKAACVGIVMVLVIVVARGATRRMPAFLLARVRVATLPSVGIPDAGVRPNLNPHECLSQIAPFELPPFPAENMAPQFITATVGAFLRPPASTVAWTSRTRSAATHPARVNGSSCRDRASCVPQS